MKERSAAKGSLFVHAREFVIGKRGEDGWNRTLDALTEADRSILRGIVLAGGWYGVGTWNRLTTAYARIDSERGVEDMARHIGAADMTLLYKVILKVGSTEMLLGRAPSLYSRYFTTGSVDAHSVGPRRWELTLRGPVGEDEAPNALACGHGIPNWIAEAMRMTGASRARVVQTSCRFQRASECRLDVAW